VPTPRLAKKKIDFREIAALGQLILLVLERQTQAEVILLVFERQIQAEVPAHG
jgi:hypothetical protein